MSRWLALAAIPAFLASAAPRAASGPTRGLTEEHKRLPGFGSVDVYRPTNLAEARGVVLFVSGDGGWNLGVVDMARRIAPHAIVAGLSMPAWQKRVEAHAGACWYPAAELETAAQALEKSYRLPRYVAPILVGYSSGATVVYGALAQSPPTTFRGAVSLGFCPDLEVKRPWCGTKTWSPKWDASKHQSWLTEAPSMSAREDGGTKWIALQGTIDQVCAPDETIAFVGRVPHARIVVLDRVGHGFSVPARWGSAFDAAVAEMLEQSPITDPAPHVVRRDAGDAAPDEIVTKLESLDLPLEIVWPAAPRAVVVFVSGDGGWAELDRSVARGLAARGIAVVGWNTLRYFWLEKTPERFGGDLERLLAALPAALPKFAGGYSFGAETVPVVAARAAGGSPLRSLAGLVLIAPGRYATFEVSPLDWVSDDPAPSPYGVPAALDALEGVPTLCLEPADGADGGCAPAKRPGLERVALPGGHHLGGDYDGLASRIGTFVSSNSPR